MSKSLKRLLSLVMVIIMLLSMMPTTVFATEEESTSVSDVTESTVATEPADPAAGKVAKVGENYYADLQEAIVAAAPSGTVELLSDVTVDKWIMISQRLSIGSGQIITVEKIDDLTIDGNNHTLTVKDIESAGNGNRLFYDADKLNIQDLTIEYVDAAAKLGGIGLTSGTISNVTFNSGIGVLPGTGNITITGCKFNTNGCAIYNEEERDNLVVAGNTFNTAAGQYAIYLRGNTIFTDNTVITGKVNVTNSATGTISGNDFGTERFKVYNGATATISNNKINNLVFHDKTAPAAIFTENTLSESAQAALDEVMPDPVAMIGDTKYTSLQEALDAAAAGTGDITVEILEDVNLTGINWKPVTVSGPGYPSITVNGNKKTVTGLNEMLFASTWAGKSGLIINDLTIRGANIAHDVEDAAGNIGVGAFIGYPQASATITLNNCHLVDSTVSGGHWTGGLIGMAGGYNGNDGPVFMNLTITGCSVTGSTITGKGSAGGVIGHGSCAAWTNVVIENTTVSGNTITSTGSSTNKAGSVMGTIGAAGQETTAAGQTLKGGAFVSATVSGNTVTSGGTTITTVYGRQGTATGTLEITGGSYDSYPIEENVAYAYPAEDFKIVENNGIYTLTAVTYVAQIGETKFETLAEALAAAVADDTVTILAGAYNTDLVVNKDITVVGQTDADGNNLVKLNGTVSITANGVTVKNLDIAVSVENEVTALYINGGNILVEGCNISGYNVTRYSYVQAGGVTFKNCVLDGYDYTLHFDSLNGDLYIDGCTMDDWSAIGAGGNVYVTNTTFVKGETQYNTIRTWTNAVYDGCTFDKGYTVDLAGTAAETLKVNNSKYSDGTDVDIALFKANDTENYDITVNGVKMAYAAMVGDTYYTTLQAAMKAAKSGETVVMLADAADTGTLSIPAGVTLDGNGKKLTGNSSIFVGAIADGEVTVKNLTQNTTGNSIWNEYLEGKLTITGCTFENSGWDSIQIIPMNGAEIVIEGNTFLDSNKRYVHIQSSSAGVDFSATVSGNKMYAPEDGTVVGPVDVYWFNDAEKVDLSGNYIAPALVGETCVLAKENGKQVNMMEEILPLKADDTLTTDLTYAAVIKTTYNGTFYSTLLEALTAAKDGETVTMLADTELFTRLIFSLYTNGKNVTLDGNGYRLYASSTNWGTGNGKHLINVNCDNVTLKDIVLDCNNIAEGANIYKAQNIVFDNVSIINKKGFNADLTVNGSTLTVENKLSASYVDVSLGKGVTTDLGIVAEEGAVLDVRTLQIASAGYPNTNLDAALSTDGTSYYSFKKVDANGNLAGYSNTLSRLSNGYGYELLEDVTVSSNVTLLNAGHTGSLNTNGHTLTVADGKTLTVNGDLSVTGTGTVAGDIALGDEGASISGVSGLDVTTTKEGYAVEYVDGVYQLAQYVAQVGDTYYATLAEAMAAAIEAGASEVKVLKSVREKMSADYEWILNADLTITADAPVTVDFYNEGTSYDIVINSNNNNTLTIDENVTITLKDRLFWLGYYGNNVDVIVKGTLEGSQIWHGADTTVTSTGKLISSGEAFVLRRGATLTVDGGVIEANYFSILSGNIDAKNATITSGPIWVGNTGNYDNEGGVSLKLDNSTWTSIGNIKLVSEKTATMELVNGSSVTTVGTPVIDANSVIVADATSTCTASNNSVFVATVGTKQYSSLQAAIKAAQAGKTVTLIADAAEVVNIPDGLEVTLDLNGKTLNGSILAPNADITVINGSIVNTNSGVSGLEINAGKLTLTNVNIDSARHAIRIDGTVEAVINGGIYRGAIGTGAGTYHAANISGDAVVTIKDGIFVGPAGTTADSGSALCTKSTVYIEGGTFSGGKNSTLVAKDGGTLAVSGGTFDQPVADAYCADGYIPADNGDGTYGVKVAPKAHFETGAYASTAPAKPREHVGINVYDIVAYESLVIKVYDTNGNHIVTSTYREYDLDDLETKRYPLISNRTTVNIVVSGKEAGSWLNEWHIAPSVANIPATFEVWVDGELKDTWTGFKSEEEKNDYIAFEGVYKAASVTDTEGNVSYFATLQDAIDAAGEGDTVTVLTDLTEGIVIAADDKITLDLNGKTVTSAVSTIVVDVGELTVKDSGTDGKIISTDTTGVYEAIAVKNGGKLILESGTVESGYYGIYAYSSVGNIVMTDGTVKAPYMAIAAGAGSVSITGGTVICDTYIVYDWDRGLFDISGGIFSQKPNASYIVDGYGAKEVTVDGATWYQIVELDPVAKIGDTEYKTIKAALAAWNEGDVIDLLSDVTIDAIENGGYGKAGVVINGQVIDGNGYTLTVNGAGGTWDCGVYITAGTVKNLTVKGSFRGIFTAGASDNIYLDNVNFENVVYTFNSDAGNKNYGVYISNSALNGWTSYSDVHKEVVFTNCTFGKGGDYACCRPYNTTIFDGCTFEEGYVIDGTQSDMTFKGMGAESAAALVNGEVAMIANGEAVTFYPTLAEAIAAAQNGDTITVLTDIELTDTVTIPADKTITLDLNGKTVSMNYAETVTTNHQMIYNKGNLTIQDSNGNGKLSYQYTGGSLGTTYAANTITTEPGSVLTVKSGTIENLTYDCAVIAYAIDGRTNGGSGDVTVNIEGGTITSQRQSIRIFANSTTDTGTLNISGGDITGRVIVQNASAKANKAVLNITDGTFNANAYKTDVLYVGGSQGATIDITAEVKGGTFNGEINSSITSGFISGGTFTTPVPEAYCAEGYIPADNGDGTYGVKLGSYKAQIGETKYETLEEAMKALKDNDTLVLLEDVTISEKWDCRYNGAKITASNVTIDGNEHTITLTGTVDDKNWNTIFRFEGDNATVKNLTIDASNATGIQRGISSKLSLTIDNCMLIGNGTTAKRAVIYGEGAREAIGDVTVSVTNSTFTGWSLGVSDNQNAQDAKAVTVTGNTFNGSDVLISASENVTFNGNTMNDAYANISSYSVPNTLSVTATGNTLMANTDAVQNTITAATIDAQEGFITPVAENNGVLYLELQKAINKAGEGDTIKLLADCGDEMVFVNKQLTIMKNGFALTENLFTIKGYGSYEDDDKLVVVVMEAPTGDAGEKLAYIDINNDGYVDETLMTLQAALDLAAAGETVKLLRDLTVNAVVIIPNNVTLDIEKNVLTVKAMIALSGGKLLGAYDSVKENGVLDGGLLKVSKENLILNAEPATVNGIAILPIWDPTPDIQCYRFSQVIVNTDPETDNRGLEIYKHENDDTIIFRFKNMATQDLYDLLMKNYGGTDLGFSVIARIEWDEVDKDGNEIVEYHNFVYSDETIQKCATNHQYFFRIANFSKLGIDLDSLRVTATFVTDSGATAYSEVWTDDIADIFTADSDEV